MKTASIILSSLTTLMVLSQLICGLWIRSQGADPGSLVFHTRFGIGTVILTLITLLVMLIFIFKR